jgi:hypothetical protein
MQAEQEQDWRGESEATRADRNLAELLQELRVAGLGVQVLFGFLLALPFTSKFGHLNRAQRGLYVADLVLAAAATVLVLAPVAYHRLVFRQHRKERLVRWANRMAIYGLVAVALAISSAVLLVVSYVEPGVTAVLVTIFAFGMFSVLWFAVPLANRRRAAATGEPQDRGLD